MATQTVKELIIELLKHEMNAPVFIGLGGTRNPDGGAVVRFVDAVAAAETRGGVYLIPDTHLIDADDAHLFNAMEI